MANKYSPYPGDTIPAVLEDGEYVLNRNAVKAIGKDKLDRINHVEEPRFAQNGGFMENAGFPTQNKFKLGLARKMAHGGIATRDAQQRRNQLLKIPNYIENYGIPTGNENLDYNPEFREMNYNDNEVVKAVPNSSIMDFMLQQKMNSNANPFNERDYLDESGFINRNFKRDDGSDPTKPGGQLLSVLSNKYGKDAREYMANPEVARMIQENPYIHSKVEDILNSRKTDSMLRAERNEPLTEEEINNSRINTYDEKMLQAIQDADDLRETNYDIEMMNLGAGPSMFDYDAIEKRGAALNELKAGMQRAKKESNNIKSKASKSDKFKKRLTTVEEAVEPTIKMFSKKAKKSSKDIAKQVREGKKGTSRFLGNLGKAFKKGRDSAKNNSKTVKTRKSNTNSVKKSDKIIKKVTKKNNKKQPLIGPMPFIGPMPKEDSPITDAQKNRYGMQEGGNVMDRSTAKSIGVPNVDKRMQRRLQQIRLQMQQQKLLKHRSGGDIGLYNRHVKTREESGDFLTKKQIDDTFKYFIKRQSGDMPRMQEGGMVSSVGDNMSGVQMNSRRLLNMAKRRKNVRS